MSKQTPAQKAAAKKAAAKKVAAAKEAAAKEARYIASLSNPITSQYDPRITLNAMRPTGNGGFDPYNPEMAADLMTSYAGPNPPVKSLTTEIVEPVTGGRALLRQSLREAKLPASIIDGSIEFVYALMDDGMTEENAINALYNNKSFTTKAGKTIESPFYAKYTVLGEGLSGAQYQTPKYLMEFSQGVEDLVKRYGFSDKFASQDSLKKYLGNQVKITDLDERFASAKLKTAEADPYDVKTLQALGYINSAQDLADFYLDPTIGTEKLETNRKTAAFAEQALRRASSGIRFDATRLSQLAATTGSEAQAEQVAAQGYETIGLQLQPLTKLEGIYGGTGQKDTIIQGQLQTQLEEEQFRGTASETRKKRKEQEELAFKKRSGNIMANRYSTGSLGGGSEIGMI